MSKKNVIVLRHGYAPKDILDKLVFSEFVGHICEFIVNNIPSNYKLIIYTSPLERAFQTAEIIAQYLKDTYEMDVNIINDDKLMRNNDDEKKYARFKRFKSLFDQTKILLKNQFMPIYITHSSSMSHLCRVLTGITKKTYKEKYDCYYADVSLVRIKFKSKIMEHNKSFGSRNTYAEQMQNTTLNFQETMDHTLFPGI